jgi:hypothetical protein
MHRGAQRVSQQLPRYQLAVCCQMRAPSTRFEAWPLVAPLQERLECAQSKHSNSRLHTVCPLIREDRTAQLSPLLRALLLRGRANSRHCDR